MHSIIDPGQALVREVDPAPCSANTFMRQQLQTEALTFVRKCLKGLYHRDLAGAFRHNSPSVSRSYYDENRRRMRNWASDITLDQLIYGDASYQDPRVATGRFVLLNDRLVWANSSRPRSCVLERLRKIVDDCVGSHGRVVELGSGDGRNLLHLRSLFPDRTFVGLEISPNSVQIARELSGRYNLPVTFLEADVSQGIPAELPLGSIDLVFSCHTLQMMPRIFEQALKATLDLSRKHVVLLEPVCELWPWNIRGIASRIRCLNADQARGIMSAIARLTKATAWRLTRAERLKAAANPFAETCEVRLERIP
jgi:SAM-dependent methyltransferase